MTFATRADIAHKIAPPHRFENLGLGEAPVKRRGTKQFEQLEQDLIDADNREFERRQKLKNPPVEEPIDDRPMVVSMRTAGDYLSNPDRPNKLFSLCCAVQECHKYDMLSPSRRRDITLKRQIAMTVLATQTRLTTPQVGRKFKRDHSTVIHARDKMFSHPHWQEQYNSVLNRVLTLEKEMHQMDVDRESPGGAFPYELANKIWCEGGGTREIAACIGRPEFEVWNNLDAIKGFHKKRNGHS